LLNCTPLSRQAAFHGGWARVSPIQMTQPVPARNARPLYARSSPSPFPPCVDACAGGVAQQLQARLAAIRRRLPVLIGVNETDVVTLATAAANETRLAAAVGPVVVALMTDHYFGSEYTRAVPK